MINFLYWYIGLAGTTPLENTDMYGVMDAIEMLWGKFSDYFFEKDAQRKVPYLIVL